MVEDSVFVLHCENAVQDDYWSVEPDASPVYCRPKDD